MKRVRGTAAILVAAAVLIGFGQGASAACQLQQLAEYKLTMDGNEAFVDGAINGQPIRLRVDTGSTSTIITRTAAAALKLDLVAITGLYYGVGGSADASEAKVREFKVGNGVVHNVRLIVTGQGSKDAPYAGFLGEDLLAQTDLELDFAHGAIRMIRPVDCKGDQVAYWGQAYSIADLAAVNDLNALEIYVSLNGRQVLAEMDTGSPTSVVTTIAAMRAGVAPHSEGVQAAGQSGGIGPHLVDTSVATFSTFSIGDETVKNAKLQIADLFAQDTEGVSGSHIAQQVEGLPQMLLGADFVRAHRIYIARSQRKLYFSYNGGPIFQILGPSAGPDGLQARVEPEPDRVAKP